MKGVHGLLRDRRRSQRGSVLSGVLIITAFIAVLAGALMTELSTNFMLSAALQHRVDDEATVNSAMELAFDRLQGQSVYQGCPALPQASVNGLAASATYVSCAASLDPHSTTPYSQLSSTAPITVDGTYSSAFGEYLVGDSAGTFYRFKRGQSVWSAAIGGAVSAPPAAMPDGTIAVPVAGLTGPGYAGCGSAGDCVAMLSYPAPTPNCYLQASARVSARPAAGVNNPSVTFFGDGAGNLFAYVTSNEECLIADQVNLPQPVVLGPIVFPGPTSKRDEVFIGLSDGTTSELVQYDYSSSRGFALVGSSPFLWQSPGRAVGAAFDSTSLPARLAVTFASGGVELLQVQSGSISQIGATYHLPTPLSGQPAWCCAASPGTFGVGGQNGVFYVFDGNPGVVASYQLGGPVYGTPSVDGGGDYFVAAGDGNVYEIPAIQSSRLSLSFGGGMLGSGYSSVQVAVCGGWVCAYGGSDKGGAYVVQLDARQVEMWACIGSAPAGCTGQQPRLWTTVQIGSFSSTQTVHIERWSYFSP